GGAFERESIPDCQHHGQVLGPAARHDRGGSGVAHGGLTPELRQAGNDLVLVAGGVGEELGDGVVGGGHRGQPVGPALLEEVLGDGAGRDRVEVGGGARRPLAHATSAARAV